VLSAIVSSLLKGNVPRFSYHFRGFREFQAARRTIQGYEAVHMIRKGQVRWLAEGNLLRQNQFIDKLFDLAA
jgi:hypothetical protein